MNRHKAYIYLEVTEGLSKQSQCAYSCKCRKVCRTVLFGSTRIHYSATVSVFAREDHVSSGV